MSAYTRTLPELMGPIIRESRRNPKNAPLAYLIQPGDDWPRDVEKPPEPVVYLPPIPKALMKLVPADTMREIRAEADRIVHELGLPADATVKDVVSGKYQTMKPGEGKQEVPLEKHDFESPAGARHKIGWTKSMVGGALIATASLMNSAHGAISTSNMQRTPPAAVSNLQAIGVDRKRRHASNRAGLTITELLVCIGIVAVLAAVLLPAIQNARDTAREAQWQNNMRQVGIAIHNHEAAQRKIPYSVSYVDVGQGSNNPERMVPHNWLAEIMPELGNNPVYDMYDMRKRPENQSPEVRDAYLSVLNHPSFQEENGRIRMAAISSAGTAATDPVAIANQDGVKKDYLLQQNPNDFHVAMPPQWVMNDKGRWQKLPQPTLASMTDGTSHVPMVVTHGHEAGNRDPWLDGQTRVTGLTFGVEVGQARINAGLMGNVTQDSNFVTNHVIGHNGQRHPEYITTLFADGHVARVKATGPKNASWFTTGAVNWRKMALKDDGNTPDEDLNR